jgi:hypothetical protein
MHGSATQLAQKDTAAILDSNTKPVTNQQCKTTRKRPLSDQDENASTEDEPLAKRREVAMPSGWTIYLDPVLTPALILSAFCDYLSRDDDIREEASEKVITKIRGGPRFDPKKVGKEQARQNITEYLENNEFHFRSTDFAMEEFLTTPFPCGTRSCDKVKRLRV